jgi:pantoate--beta-alanine ligase
MEGKMRPGHFNGVVQVVSKLFYMVQPDRAYFGEKDYQQLAIIRRMKDVMHFDIQIIGCPIVREASGLALSSRNERLSPAEKETAVNISRVLFASLDYAKTHSVSETEQWVISEINGIEGLEVEYYEIVDQTTLLPVQDFSHAIGCVTVYSFLRSASDDLLHRGGPVRLIDNIKY